MGGKKKYIEMFGSLTEPFNYCHCNIQIWFWQHLHHVLHDMVDCKTVFSPTS